MTDFRTKSPVFMLSLSATLVTFGAAVCQAAPGTLADQPLFLSATVSPNIMFLIDNSGSMNNIVPDVPYDENTTYTSCPSSRKINDNKQIDVRVQSDGDSYFTADGTSYDWGTDSGNGHTNHTKKCFKSDDTYDARLYGNDPADSSSSTKQPDFYLTAEYSGNYLNWYFGEGNLDWGSGARNKTGTQRRLDIAQSASADLMNSLNNVRVGLSTYSTSTDFSDSFNQDVQILVGIDDITTVKTSMISEINGLTANAVTPLSESLHGIGRYFVQGHNNTLTLHPSDASPTTASAYSVFDETPTYASGVTQASPIQNFCQKNFAVLMTDGRPQADQALDGNSYLKDYDDDCAGGSCDSYDRKSGRVYESDGSDYLDDVAKALYEIDLRPDLDDFDGNEVVNNVITHMIGFADDQVINDPLMQDTADNGGGEFITASNASGLTSAFESAIDYIVTQTGTAASVAFNSDSLDANSTLYLSQFNSIRWSGDVLAYALNSTSGAVSASKTWSAADQLDDDSVITPSTRTILTSNASDGVAFSWNSLTSAQKNDLKTDPDGGTSTDTVGQARLDYLRGDRSNEGSGENFRIRSSRLGDIVHSSPVYIGAPSLDWPDQSPFPDTSTTKYSKFESDQASRTPVLYVGANDGMLHGFRADNGKEVLAYIPSNLFSTSSGEGLHYLTDPDYEHRFYVDLTPTISDVYIKTTTSGTEQWATVLIGGQRAGGRGLFALDITDPSVFSESGTGPADTVLWELGSSDDADLGHTFGQPTLVLMNNGKWAAIFGNGYNDSGSGTAQLFIVFLEGGLDGTWTSGTDYIKINTQAGDTTDRNGLASPGVVDLDGNGTADRVYAGDLEGNMWAFDVSSSTDSSWKVAYEEFGTTPVPLFTGATDQAITTAPSIVRNPQVNDSSSPSNEPNLVVLFGTGQYLVDADNSTTATQSFYGVWDDGTQQLDRTKLVEQTFETGFSSDVRVLSDNPVFDEASDSTKGFGWYIDLPDSGERLVTNPLVRGDNVFFNTTVPDATACSSGGTGWQMVVEYANGGRPEGAVFDYDGDGDVDTDDLVSNSDSSLSDVAPSGEKYTKGLPAGSTILGSKQYTPDSKTEDGDDVDLREIEEVELSNLGRLSWKQLID